MELGSVRFFCRNMEAASTVDPDFGLVGVKEIYFPFASETQ